MVMQLILVVLLWTLAAVTAAWLFRRFLAGVETQHRLFGGFDEQAPAANLQTDDMGFIRRWLFVAGFRGEWATTVLLATSAASAALGAAIISVIFLSGTYALMISATSSVPGGVGEVFLPAVYATPWLLLLLTAAFPFLTVYQARKKRVESVERDLPLTLELLATLSEAGLGFDGALARIYETRLGDGPLAGELRSYQADLLAGRPRIQCLRRLSDRLRMPVIATFVSALVQAEQLGMGISQVLRRQADDVRDRRRERANGFAQSLPVKRVIPLVVCFLPGLFVWTLGPFFVQLLQLADTFTRVRSFGP